MGPTITERKLGSDDESCNNEMTQIVVCERLSFQTKSVPAFKASHEAGPMVPCVAAPLQSNPFVALAVPPVLLEVPPPPWGPVAPRRLVLRPHLAGGPPVALREGDLLGKRTAFCEHALWSLKPSCGSAELTSGLRARTRGEQDWGKHTESINACARLTPPKTKEDNASVLNL